MLLRSAFQTFSKLAVNEIMNLVIEINNEDH